MQRASCETAKLLMRALRDTACNMATWKGQNMVIHRPNQASRWPNVGLKGHNLVFCVRHTSSSSLSFNLA